MKRQIIIMLIFFLSIIQTVTGKDLFSEEKGIETNKIMELTKTAIPVEVGEKYKISFVARAGGKYVIEENERIRIMNLKYMASRARIAFYDEQGKAFNYRDVFIVSQEFHDYVQVFYPPAKAKTVKISLLPGKESNILLKKISLSTDVGERERESINPHPTFDYGDLNFYGCDSGFGGQFYTRPDGKTVWKTGFLGYSSFFPVKGDAFYDFYCRGIKYRDRKSYILLECFKVEENKPFKSMQVAISEKGEVTKLKMPPGTVYARLCCYCVIIEEFKVTP
jgi:hypothetical protein